MSTISTHQRVQATRRILRDTSQTQERTKTTTQFPISTNTSSSLSPSTPKTNTNNFALPSNTTTTVQFDSSSVAVTALILLSALFFLGFFSVYARHFFTNDQDDDYHTSNFHGRHGRNSSTNTNNRRYLSSAPRGLDPTVIKTLPVICFNTQKVTSSGDCDRCGCCGCVVCLSEFDDGEIVKVIPCCGHLFHPQCIDSWLVAHASCPLCRSTELFGSVNQKIEDGGRGLLGSSVDTIGRHLVEECELVGVAVEGGRDEEEVLVSIGAEDQTQMSRVLLDDGYGGSGGLGRSRSWSCCTSAVEGEDKNIDELPRRSCSR